MKIKQTPLDRVKISNPHKNHENSENSNDTKNNIGSIFFVQNLVAIVLKRPPYMFISNSSLTRVLNYKFLRRSELPLRIINEENKIHNQINKMIHS